MLGLGNPGARYEETRHNMGFAVLDALVVRLGTSLRPGPGSYEAAATEFEGETVLLAKPTTYVNRSGRAAHELLQRHQLPPERLLVVVDDVYLPFGRLRLRPGGGPGGHNGLESIQEALQSNTFPRLRCGVGSPPPGVDLADWVLGPFAVSEREALGPFVDRAADAVAKTLRLGVRRAQPQVNSQTGAEA